MSSLTTVDIHAADLELLKRITSLPTASGREFRVHNAIRAWAARHPRVRTDEDACGNLTVLLNPDAVGSGAPLYITAHTDHPAFVVERIIAPGTIELSFRGGVMDVFFERAPITLHTRDDRRLSLTLIGDAGQSSPAGKHYLAEIAAADARHAGHIAPGDVATWALPDAEIIDGVLHAPGCDDQAALAAALATGDRLLADGSKPLGDVRLLFTRSEEIGFIGAIGACRGGTIPKGSRLLALENSRAFEDSPVGGGPIVRVGDRISVFTPWLTAACAAKAEEIFNGPATPRASERTSDAGKRPWQRKLMAGGACEASVFCAHGYDATCICLPLGNYHNMPHLAELQANAYDAARLGPPRCEREFIHTQDYLSMIDLLCALGRDLPGPQAFLSRLEKMYTERQYVLRA